MTAAMRVACVQMRLGATLAEDQAHALELLRDAARQGAQLALLPEYWFLATAEASRGTGTAGPAEGVDLLGWLREASAKVGIAVAGNALVRDPLGIWNVLGVFDRGAPVGEQRKVHPMPTEERWGVKPAQELAAFPWRGTRLGGLVCADILHPEAARILAVQGAELMLNPVMSYWKPNDATREARRAMFLARAYDNACFVLKAGSVAEAHPAKLVGRSVITAPWGVLAESKDEFAEELVIADLDLDRLREERKRSLSLDRRNPKAYVALTLDAPKAAREFGPL